MGIIPMFSLYFWWLLRLVYDLIFRAKRDQRIVQQMGITFPFLSRATYYLLIYACGISVKQAEATGFGRLLRRWLWYLAFADQLLDTFGHRVPQEELLQVSLRARQLKQFPIVSRSLFLMHGVTPAELNGASQAMIARGNPFQIWDFEQGINQVDFFIFDLEVAQIVERRALLPSLWPGNINKC